ncbi:MAG TPA: LysR substrate-binding domain-containing protein [Steroidobacter sp.]
MHTASSVSASANDPTAINDESLRVRAPGTQLLSRRALPPFETLRAFDAIARLGGVRKAAQYLCRDHAVVSRHLRAIEDWTGTKLIQRTAAGSVLTEDGIRYHRDIASALDIIARATVDLIKRGDNRCLHIRCMPGFALHWLSGHLGDFEKANPGLDVELQPANRSPEFLSADTDIEIRFIGAYRAPLQLPPHLRSVELARAPIVAVASQAYLASAPPVREPRDLLKHQLLHEQDSDGWRRWLAAHGVAEEGELPGPRLWQGHLTLEGARFGRGIALTNLLIVAEDIAAGRLTDVTHQRPAFVTQTGIYHFIARADRWQSRVIERFRHWLTATIAKEHPELAP